MIEASWILNSIENSNVQAVSEPLPLANGGLRSFAALRMTNEAWLYPVEEGEQKRV